MIFKILSNPNYCMILLFYGACISYRSVYPSAEPFLLKCWRISHWDFSPWGWARDTGAHGDRKVVAHTGV